MNNTTLKGRNALVTGASKGLGRAMAIALANNGAHLILVARDREKLEGVAKEIVDTGGQADVFPADITKEDQVLQLEADVRSKIGPVQILINNAGTNLRRDISDFTLAEWRGVQDTNVTSAFLMCRAFVPHMKGAGYGRIINMTSIMAHVSIPQRSLYSSTKAALLGITKALALELATEGITVNGISPGPIATEMNAPILQNPELNAQFISKIPVGRWGKVEEVGALAAFLCGDDAGFITGTDILIDGGWCAA
ncbi:MAG: SDR family NAD(P)-dependent oxidoreductase [Bryobacteraceae bacterium]|jgi:NAD(P)-dependent dehydrogenase (short-subunit alcohol dehydrogenase family)